MSTFTLVDFIFVAAGLSLLASYLARNILTLRLLTCFGYILLTVAAVSVGYVGWKVYALMSWSAVNLAINLYQVYLVLLERRPMLMRNDLREIYEEFFSDMRPREFLRFYKLATNYILIDQVLIEGGKLIDGVYFLLKGKVEIIVNGKIVRELDNHCFLGDFSYLCDTPPNATVRAHGRTQYLYWSRKTLKQLKMKNLDTYLKFTQLVAVDAIKKLLTDNERAFYNEKVEHAVPI